MCDFLEVIRKTLFYVIAKLRLSKTLLASVSSVVNAFDVNGKYCPGLYPGLRDPL